MSATGTGLEAAEATTNAPERKLQTKTQFVINTATILSAQIGRALSSLLLEVVYARILGPSGRGQLSLCMMVLGCAVLVGSLGGEIPIMLWSADKRQKPSEWLPSLLFCGFLGSVLACGTWAFLFWKWHPVFLRGLNGTLALLLLGAIPFTILGAYCLALLVGLDRLRERSVLVVSNQLVTLIAAAALLYFIRPSAEMGLVAVLIGLFVVLIYAAKCLKSYVTELRAGVGNLSRVGAALKLGLRGQLGNVATFFNYRLDVFFVNYYLNTTEVGLYALGVMVSESLWQVPNAAAMALVPRTARQTDASGVQFTCMVCRQVFVLACAMAVAVAALSAWLVPLVFGEKFSASVPVIWWILPGTVALAGSKVMCADLLGRGVPEYSTIFAFVSLVVTVGLDLLLIPRMGIQGAALASSAAYFINSLLIAMVLRHKLDVTWKDLYIPSSAEFAPYRQIANRCWARLRPTAAH